MMDWYYGRMYAAQQPSHDPMAGGNVHHAPMYVSHSPPGNYPPAPVNVTPHVHVAPPVQIMPPAPNSPVQFVPVIFTPAATEAPHDETKHKKKKPSKDKRFDKILELLTKLTEKDDSGKDTNSTATGDTGGTSTGNQTSSKDDTDKRQTAELDKIAKVLIPGLVKQIKDLNDDIAKLKTSIAKKPSPLNLVPLTKPLSQGSWDPQVTTLQVLLGRHLYYTNTDGYFGPDTERQLKAFQKSKGLPETGITDAATIKLLTA